jgi:CRISPR-associated protein Csx10
MSFHPIYYRLHLFGDLHVGSGLGLPGVVDAFVSRGNEEFAFIPGSQIKGLVRDSCLRLLEGLNRSDDICPGQESWNKMSRLMQDVEVENFCGMQGTALCVLCALFGSPVTPGSWWFSDATYDKDYRDNVKGAGLNSAVRDRSTSAHASIDPKTKRAEEDHLFSFETVRTQKQAWVGKIELINDTSTSPAQQTELLGILTASLLFTRRVGGRRRRGWGRCRFEIPAISQLSAEEPLGNITALAAVKNLLLPEVSNGHS